MCSRFISAIMALAPLLHSALSSTDDSSTFSVCWMIKESTSLERLDVKLQINDSEVAPEETYGKVGSLTVAPSDTHTLTLKYRGAFQLWRFSVPSGLNTIVVRSEYKAHDKPTNETLEALRLFNPMQVFACENNTLYLNQEHVILVLGSTYRFPLKVESRSNSTLLVSWVADSPLHPDHVHLVLLFQSNQDAQVIKVADATHANQYRFTSLDPCSNYMVCLEQAASPAVMCVKALTDPAVPTNFSVTAWNSSSVTVAWACSENQMYSSFLLTMLQLNGSGHVVQMTSFKHEQEPFVFMVNDLPPCTKVKLGLQTVCDSSGESRKSSLLVIDGNSANSEIGNLHQVASSPGSYTLSWTVPNTSSIAVFRVYHQGVLQKSTFLTMHRVSGLRPCRQYKTRVDAVCGDSIVMSTRTIQTTTGPGDILDLQFHQLNSSASWSSASGPSKAFAYCLSHANGSLVKTGRLRKTAMPLPGLLPGSSYELEVWEECGGELGRPAVLPFTRLLVPSDDIIHDASHPAPRARLIASFQEPKGKVRVELEHIIRTKLQALLSGFPRPVEVQLLEFVSLGDTMQTKMPFQVLGILSKDVNVTLSSEELLTHIQSLNHPQITIEEGLIYWDDPDECAFAELNQCDSGSTCINTLVSYTCVCKHGFYNIGRFLIPPVPSACYKNGTFTQCRESLVAGGISKAFLTDYFGGSVRVILNNGRCAVNETDEIYFFRIAHNRLKCGAQRQVNQSHVEFSSTLTVTLSHETTVIRKDLRIVWKCIYPRYYPSGVHISVDTEWFNNHSVSSTFSHILDLGMTLYNDSSFTNHYTDGVLLSPTDYLFLEVTLHARGTFVDDVLLEVLSCWATESPDATHDKKAFFLKDGCPADDTFFWYTLNGSGKSSRFSVQMFTMSVDPQVPIYIHCLTKICSPDENCVTVCPPTKNNSKVKRHQKNRSRDHFAVLSVGPVFMDRGEWMLESRAAWNGLFTMIALLVGTTGILVLTVLGVCVLNCHAC